MNQTIAKIDVAPSRQQERGISGHGVFPLTTTQRPEVRKLYYLARKVKALPANIIRKKCNQIIAILQTTVLPQSE